MRKTLLFAAAGATLAAVLVGAQTASTQQAPAPGAYVVESMFLDFCLKTREAGWPRVPYLTAQDCFPVLRGGQRDDSFTMLLEADPSGRFRLRVGDRCMTRARGVIHGPPAADMLPCDGQADQLFSFEPTGGALPQPWRIRADNGSCLKIRNFESSDREMIFSACDTVFRLHSRSTAITPVPLSRPGYAFEEGIDRPGFDIDSFLTANDGGQECIQRCLANPRCRAITWVRPGIQDTQRSAG